MSPAKHITETLKLRSRVLTEVARLAINETIFEEIDELPEKLVSMANQRYRCCEYKEKAIYAERIKLALGLSQKEEYKKKRLSELLPIALEFPDLDDHQINVIDIACESCPINKFFVSNACQNCLAHHCLNSCPRDAISVVQNQAYIDQTLCVECGLCKKSCPYGAILEINRPCEASCQIGAINATNTDRKAKINIDSCVECGSCIKSCPFGAISDKAQILKVIKLLQEQQTFAIIAPSFIGQFDTKNNTIPVYKGLNALGFKGIFEAALGADIVALEEVNEFIDNIPAKKDFMTSSCCPSFVKLIKKHHPQLEKNISTIVSPMIATAQYIKLDNPDAKIVFIGPCISKKSEARENQIIDAVLTFEELNCMFSAADIDLSKIETNEKFETNISSLGRGFAAAGGVAKSVKTILENKEIDCNCINVQGLGECTNVLKELEKGDSKIDFLEGMACSGGCLGGPASLKNPKLTKRFLEKSCQDLIINPEENNIAKETRIKIAHDLHNIKKLS